MRFSLGRVFDTRRTYPHVWTLTRLHPERSNTVEDQNAVEDQVDSDRPVANDPLAQKQEARPRRTSVTLALDGATAAALDHEAATQGLPDRRSVVRQAVEQYLLSQTRRRELAKDERAVRKGFATGGREIFEAESSGSTSYRCQVSAREVNAPIKPRKALWVRLLHAFDEPLFPGRPRQDVYIQRHLLPWLIEALQGAEAALQEDVRQRRAAAQALRAALPKEQQELQRQIRARYVQRYSQKRVTIASTLASRHRARAQAYGQTEHFTTWEWLDLCDGFNFRCPLCGADEPLTPHHGVPLSEGGGNDIGNILPLCEGGHSLVHWNGAEYASGWMARQQALCREVTPGSVVEYRPANPFHDALSAIMRGVVVSVTEPAPSSPLDSSMHDSDLRCVLAAEGTRVRPWFPAQAQVRFLGQSDEYACDLDTLTKLEPGEYDPEQDAWLAH